MHGDQDPQSWWSLVAGVPLIWRRQRHQDLEDESSGGHPWRPRRCPWCPLWLDEDIHAAVAIQPHQWAVEGHPSRAWGSWTRGPSAQGLLEWLHHPRNAWALGQWTIQVHRVQGALDALRGGGASRVSGLQHLCRDCSICLQDETSNTGGGHAMEMPSCGHTFHRKCITKWFGRSSTCSMCRLDLSTYLDLAVQRFLLHFTEEYYWL
jgi:hypothetical protein